MVNILIACQPFILNQVLTRVIEQLPGVTLASRGTAPVDIIVTTPVTGKHQLVDCIDQPWPSYGLVTLDERSNTLWVRDAPGRGTGERILLGDLETLVTVIQEMTAMIARERATRVWHIA
jgi:hypothetical protein